MVAVTGIGITPITVVAITGIGITPIPVVAVTGIGITRIPVVGIRCEPIPVIIGRTPEPSREKPALLAAKVPSREKPALLAAKVRSPVRKWETHVHSNPATAIPTLRNSVRWFHDCQRGHCPEKYDALQHESLLYLSAPPHLSLQAHTRNRKDSIGGW